jgi:beta-mannosidase
MNKLNLFACLFIYLLPYNVAGTGVVPLSWELGYISSKDAEIMKWIPASVPGAIQLDIARAENYGTWYYAENWKDYLWMEDSFFTYRSSFNKPAMKQGEHIFFVSGGIDYLFDIFLNGEKIFQQEGMFTPVKIDLTSRLRDKNELGVVIHPVPKSHPFPADRSQADHVVKPAVSYGWDWHPRLIPSGIWDETGLVIEPGSAIKICQITYNLNRTLDKAMIAVSISGRELIGRSWSWSITDKTGLQVLHREGKFAADSLSFNLELDKPKLWWPHDQGEPYLYQTQCFLFDNEANPVQVLDSKIGFRQVKLVMNTGTLADPEGFPKSRRLPPMQLEINSRRVFCKGSNWVNPEVFPGILSLGRYKELIDKALEANFNLFRVWGGGIINKESFYALCDEMGIMVWQEFPLACNNYPDDPNYLQVLEQESKSIIQRLRQHACLAVWCGGNELFNSWGGMNDQSLAIRLLNSQCLKYDPLTPFIPTSPIEGVGHGNYVFRDMQTGEEVFRRMSRAHNTAYTEFGVPSPSSVAILRQIIPENELWPPRRGTSWESHHAFNAWVGNTWLMQDMIEDYFGKSTSLEVLVAHGQLIQGEGYKYIYEEARRQKPYCSMALNWCYNEPWPTAANNNLISWPAIPKPAFYQVKNACRPVLASATISKFKWIPGELFTTRIWMLSDSPDKVKQGKIKVSLVAGEKRMELGRWNFNPIEPNTNQPGPEYSVSVPDWPEGEFKLILEVEDQPALNSEYTLLLGKTEKDRFRLPRRK